MAACDIDQRIKSSMRSVDIAAQVLEQGYSQIATILIGFRHLGHTSLGTSQSGHCRTLYEGANIRSTRIEDISYCLHQLCASNHIANAPTRHRIGFGEGIDAEQPSAIKFVAAEHGSGTDMLPLKDQLVIALVRQQVEIMTPGKSQQFSHIRSRQYGAGRIAWAIDNHEARARSDHAFKVLHLWQPFILWIERIANTCSSTTSNLHGILRPTRIRNKNIVTRANSCEQCSLKRTRAAHSHGNLLWLDSITIDTRYFGDQQFT